MYVCLCVFVCVGECVLMCVCADEWQEDSGTLKLYMNGEFVMEEKDLPPMRRNDAPLCIGMLYHQHSYVSYV